MFNCKSLNNNLLIIIEKTKTKTKTKTKKPRNIVI